MSPGRCHLLADRPVPAGTAAVHSASSRAGCASRGLHGKARNQLPVLLLQPCPHQPHLQAAHELGNALLQAEQHWPRLSLVWAWEHGVCCQRLSSAEAGWLPGEGPQAAAVPQMHPAQLCAPPRVAPASIEIAAHKSAKSCAYHGMGANRARNRIWSAGVLCNLHDCDTSSQHCISRTRCCIGSSAWAPKGGACIQGGDLQQSQKGLLAPAADAAQPYPPRPYLD